MRSSKVTRQFLPSSGNYHENPSRSTSADRLDERMKVEGSNRDGLNFFCDPNENHSAFLKRPDHSQSPLSESTSKMEGTLMIPNSPEYDSGLPGLNSRAREAIYEGILQPLLDRQYLKVFHGYLAACSTRLQTKEIICLRDLEEMLLLETCVSVFFSNVI
jgi:hypothetical protein